MIEALGRIDVAAEVARFGVVLLRTGGLVVFCPILGAEVLPPRIRVLVAIALALVMAPVVPQAVVLPNDAVDWTVVAVRELSVGFALGLAARALFAGIETAGGFVGVQNGFAMASLIDPASGASSLAPQMFQSLLATALFVAADLHHLFLNGLRQSYDVMPPAVAWPSVGSLGEAVSLLGTHMLTVAVQLAAPALVVALSADFVLLLAARALPSIPVLIIGYPAKVAVGLLSLVALAAATGSAMGWIGRTFASDGARLLAALAGR